ncbi:MAG: EAL domain-containing protein [Gemmobacter sp.]|nr:EAL domain-containing protein [Gemmobacter sp.]
MEDLFLERLSDPLSVAVAERDRQTLDLVAEALRVRRVMLAFQPVVMASNPARIAFYEGLIRIVDDTGRVVPAREFMGAVETRELGRMIDCASLEMGLAALAEVPTLRLAINMSARSIGFPRWHKTLDQGLAQDPTVGERLILEITESSAMQKPELVTGFMGDLQRRGIAFALDDFGAGYTAFRYFREFFFDVLKIDGQFIRGIASDPDNQALTRALVSIGQHFDMLTVAESVESAADADWLRAAGVDCLQGYFYGMPTVNPAWKQPKRRQA